MIFLVQTSLIVIMLITFNYIIHHLASFDTLQSNHSHRPCTDKKPVKQNGARISMGH